MTSGSFKDGVFPLKSYDFDFLFLVVTYCYGFTCSASVIVRFGCTEFLRSGLLETMYLLTSFSVKYCVTFVSSMLWRGDLTSTCLNVTLDFCISGNFKDYSRVRSNVDTIRCCEVTGDLRPESCLGDLNIGEAKPVLDYSLLRSN